VVVDVIKNKSSSGKGHKKLPIRLIKGTKDKVTKVAHIWLPQLCKHI